MRIQNSKSRRVSYTNRYGETFFIYARSTRAGVRYFAGKNPIESLSYLPASHRIYENINGKVSVVLVSRRNITDLEVEYVRVALQKIGQSCYKADVREKDITIYASADDCRTHICSLDDEFTEGFASALESLFARHVVELANVTARAEDISKLRLLFA